MTLATLGVAGMILASVGWGAAATLAAAPPSTDPAPVDSVRDPSLLTLPVLPVPSDAPQDNGPEAQQYYGRIMIPAIGVDAPFLEGVRISTLNDGPGHWPGTAMPGELGNVVVAGHRTSHDADFRHLDDLVPGDLVIFDMQNSDGTPTATVADPDPFLGRYVYEVTSIEIVTPDAMWIVSQTYRHQATLFACHPPGSVDERIVAHLDLVDPAPMPADPARPMVTDVTTGG